MRNFEQRPPVRATDRASDKPSDRPPTARLPARPPCRPSARPNDRPIERPPDRPTHDRQTTDRFPDRPAPRFAARPTAARTVNRLRAGLAGPGVQHSRAMERSVAPRDCRSRGGLREAASRQRAGPEVAVRQDDVPLHVADEQGPPVGDPPIGATSVVHMPLRRSYSAARASLGRQSCAVRCLTHAGLSCMGTCLPRTIVHLLTSRLLLTACYWPPNIHLRLRAAYYWLPAFDRPLLDAYYWPLATSRLPQAPRPPTARRRPLAAEYAPPTARRLLDRPLPAAYCWPPSRRPRILAADR